MTGKAKFCRPCLGRRQLRARANPPPEIACAHCGDTFQPYRSSVRFCNKPPCRRALQAIQDNVSKPPVEQFEPSFTTRRCRNKDCIERFVPVNPQHWFHEPACSLSDRLWSVDEILGEEGSLLPGGNALEMAKAAFGQKNRAVRENLRLRSLREYLTFEVQLFHDQHPEFRYPVMPKPPADKGTKHPREVIVQTSDWQIGKWENGFGWQATKKRVEALKTAAGDVIKRQRDAGFPVRTVRLSVGGDGLEGCFIYRGQNVTGLDKSGNTHRITVQIRVLAHEIAEFAIWLSTLADEVVVEVVGGNHGRPNGPNDYADPEDNFDVMAAWWASDITANTKRITWNVHEDWWGGFESMGHYIVSIHGDQWTGPLEKLETLLPRWVASGVFGATPNVLLTAHRHTSEHKEIAGVEVYQNGTIDGGSRWYLKAFGKASRPVQNVLVMDDTYEVESVFKVRFGGVAA